MSSTATTTPSGNAAAQPSPILFFETINAYQRTAALRSAIELDLFTLIADGQQSVPALAKESKSSERGIRILCDYLTTLGFLTKMDSRYELTQDSAAFLNRHSPVCLNSA